MKNKIRSFYAAANGYDGFRSYFDEIFSKEKLNHLFILKGGPGTGKSTLMRKILNHFSEMDLSCDAVYCSSDPNSLDGVIIDSKVAVIDGTAPHETNTKLPGAFDEIINLGESWDTKTLMSKQKEIEEINISKKENYNSAYKYLSFSGNLQNYKMQLLKNQFSYESAKKSIKCLTSNCKNSNSEPQTLLISAFGKMGFERRNTDFFDIKKAYSLKGKYGEEFIFLDVLFNFLKGKFKVVRLISPFSDKITEGIYLEDEKTVFLQGCDFAETIECSQYLKDCENREFEFLNELADMCLLKSKEAFIRASEAHFKLEEIYTDAMNFEKNEEIYEKLSEKISKILFYKE